VPYTSMMFKEDEVLGLECLGKYDLSQEAVEYFKNPDLFKLVLKEGYACENYGKALAHLCYENRDYSIHISKLLLQGISKNDYEKVKHYLDVVT